MNYREAVQYITELQQKKGSDYSLDPVRKLCELAGSPDRELSVIHIAGTNGKGSIGSYLSNILAQSGYTVGRYVSPVLFEYRERIQRIYPVPGETADHMGADGNGECSIEEGMSAETDQKREEVAPRIRTEYISRQEVAELLTKLRNLTEQMEREGESVPTAFEIETVMAFLAMRQWGVDVAVIECGMGGRTDATNIITSPILCLFARIGLDHTAFLGNTLEEIAAEKAGILKQGTAMVSVKQDKSADAVLRERCRQMGIPVYIADPQEAEQIRYHMQETVFQYRRSVLKMGQQGTCQLANAITAIRAAEVLQTLGYDQIQDRSICEAIRTSRWRGRFECISERPYVIVDGAHNPQAAAELRRSLETYFPGERFTYICGVFRDKDYHSMMREMYTCAERIYTVTPPGERGLPAALLAEEICRLVSEPEMAADQTEECIGASKPRKRQGISIQACVSVSEALELAVQSRERILVFGSLSFLQEAYAYFSE